MTTPVLEAFATAYFTAKLRCEVVKHAIELDIEPTTAAIDAVALALAPDAFPAVVDGKCVLVGPDGLPFDRAIIEKLIRHDGGSLWLKHTNEIESQNE